MIKLNCKYQEFLELALSLNRNTKRSLQILFDAFAVFCAFAGSMFLKLETTSFLKEESFFSSYLIVLIPTIYLFTKMGLYNAFMRYISSEITFFVAFITFASSSIVLLTKIYITQFIPWSVPIIYGILLFLIVTGSRFTLRMIFLKNTLKVQKNIAIYGADNSGIQLLQSLVSNPSYRVQMIIDDNPDYQGLFFYGLRVMSFQEASVKLEVLNIDVILIPNSNISFAIRKKILSKVSNYAFRVKNMPPISTLIDGPNEISEFEDVSIEDLLGRETVVPISKLLSKNILGKTVLVTGAGGSIGSELCHQIISLKPKRLLCIDVSEIGIYKISSELQNKFKNCKDIVVSIVGSIEDEIFIAKILSKYQVDTIYHAAAYKHVPLMEQNLLQAIKNNTLGTYILAKEAVNKGVSNFTLISTDKAINPTNVMGASKRIAELFCCAFNNKYSNIQFSIVRFGNVLGSSGSVVPLFKKQIALGGPITLTHPEIIRYFMSISEAVQLVIQASSLVKTSEIFVLDMGAPVKIKDLAFKMVQLSGLRPYLEDDTSQNNFGDIPIRITGLRPGEKMYEELSYDKKFIRTLHPRIMSVKEKVITKNEMDIVVGKIQKAIITGNCQKIINILIKYAHYKPDQKLIKKQIKL